jgi:hypothetical protein
LGTFNPYLDPLSVAIVKKIMFNLLLLHSLYLEGLHLIKCIFKWGDVKKRNRQFIHQSIWKWVKYAFIKVDVLGKDNVGEVINAKEA